MFSCIWKYIRVFNFPTDSGIEEILLLSKLIVKILESPPIDSGISEIWFSDKFNISRLFISPISSGIFRIEFL